MTTNATSSPPRAGATNATPAPARTADRAGPPARGAATAPFAHLLASTLAEGRSRPVLAGLAPGSGATPRSPAATAKGPEAAEAPRTGRTDGDVDREAGDPKHGPFDPLDPETRRSAHLAPPMFGEAVVPIAAARDAAPTEAPRARVSMEELLPQLVKRIAWGGDKRRGAVQLELGAGRHAGTIVTVHSDAGRLRVEVQGGPDDALLKRRIESRLTRQGLDVETT